MKDKQGDAGRAQAAADFGKSHPGEQPSSYYSNGDHYQDMRSGWDSDGCFPAFLIILLVPVVLVLLGG